jgi:hypothetical protein
MGSIQMIATLIVISAVSGGLLALGLDRHSRKEARLEAEALLAEARRLRGLGESPERRFVERVLVDPAATVADARAARRIAQHAAHPETTRRLAAVTR